MTCATCQRLQERIEDLEMLTFHDRRSEAELRLQLGLTPNESSILRVLYQANGRVLSKEFLVEARCHVSADDPSDVRKAVAVLIHRLRKKLGADVIGTSHGSGYYLTSAGRSKVEQALRNAP